MISPMITAHIPEVVGIHQACLPGDFLTALGPEFLAEAFYKELLEPDIGFGYVWVDGGHVVGYVSGAYDAGSFSKGVVCRHVSVVARSFVKRLFSSPVILVRALETAAYLLRPSLGVVGPQIRANAVLPEYRGQGIGLQLYVQGLQHFRDWGADHCTVVVSAADPVVNHLWERLGGRVEASFRLNGERRNLYRVGLREALSICSAPLAT